MSFTQSGPETASPARTTGPTGGAAAGAGTAVQAAGQASEPEAAPAPSGGNGLGAAAGLFSHFADGAGGLARQALARPLSLLRGSGYGSRTQVAAAIRELDALLGQGPQGPGGGTFVDKQPLLHRLQLLLEPGVSSGDEEARLSAFVAENERGWGQKVTDLPPGALENERLFAAEKAMDLARFGRQPSEVSDGFVAASGDVDGEPIADRNVFYQRWRPIGQPSGKVIVISPGFQETGRNFLEQARLFNQQGADVILMDHQWGGQTKGGQPGGIDRGYGVARDVAAVAAFAQGVADAEYGSMPGKQVILMGNSMGAGPGVLGAVTLNDNGKIHLRGRQMPTGLSAMLQAPFLGATPSLVNQGLGLAGRVPGAGAVPLPAAGVPVLTHDPVAQEKFAQHAALEDIRARPQAMVAALEDLKRIRDLIAGGHGPQGKIYIVQGDKDPLADPAATRQVAGQLGPRAHLDMIRSDNHVLEESPGEQRHILGGLPYVSR